MLTYKYLLIVSYYIFFRNCQVDSRSPCNKIISCPNGRTLVLSKCSYFLTILLALINIQRVKGKAANVTNTRPTPPPVVLRQTPLLPSIHSHRRRHRQTGPVRIGLPAVPFLLALLLSSSSSAQVPSSPVSHPDTPPLAGPLTLCW